MSRDTRTPASVTQIGIYTVRIFDAQAYAANIRRYYAGESYDFGASAPFDGAGSSNREGYARNYSAPFEKKKPSARYNWASWHEPMIKGGQSA